MGSVHNDLHTWAFRARKQGLSTIEIDLETADRAVEKIVELSNRVMDLEAVLRAQPPAREDALRVAVEALRWIDANAGRSDCFEVSFRARQALAALQAEQKGGA